VDFRLNSRLRGKRLAVTIGIPPVWIFYPQPRTHLSQRLAEGPFVYPHQQRNAIGFDTTGLAHASTVSISGFFEHSKTIFPAMDRTRTMPARPFLERKKLCSE